MFKMPTAAAFYIVSVVANLSSVHCIIVVITFDFFVPENKLIMKNLIAGNY